MSEQNSASTGQLQSADVLHLENFIQRIERKATRIETPCGDGAMVWRIWDQTGDDANGAVSGAPLVLTHGAQGTWYHWIRNIEVLSQYRRVILADLPGHGVSALPEGGEHADISKALHEGLGRILGVEPEPVDFCGFSFGGVVFAHFAALYPAWVKHLVLVGCGGLGTPVQPPRLGRVSGLTGEERRAVLKHNLLGMMLHHSDAADDLAIHMLLPMAKTARLSVAPLVLPDRLLRILPEVSAKVDAIWGMHDLPHPSPAVQKQALLSVKPDARFEVIEGAGHWAMYEQPEAFNQTLLSLLGIGPLD